MQGHLQPLADLVPDAWSDRLSTVDARKFHPVLALLSVPIAAAGLAVYRVVQRLSEERRMTKNLGINAPPVGAGGVLE